MHSFVERESIIFDRSKVQFFFEALDNIAIIQTIPFLIQGIRPLSWWEKTRAKKATFNAIGLWVIILIILLVMILMFKERLKL